MPTPLFFEPPDGYVEVHEPLPTPVHELLEHIEQYLTPEGTEKMKAELGEALIRSLATHNDAYVNQVVDAWVRTLFLKSIGLDAFLEKQEDPIAAGEAPIDLDELRARVR